MRWLIFFFLLLAATGMSPAEESVIQEFSGSGSTTTGFFTVPNGWEIRWNARQVVSVAVMAPDGSVIAGAAGVLRGSLFVPTGGQYYLNVTDGAAGAQASAGSEMSWHLQVLQVQATPAAQGLTVYTPYFMPPNSAVAPAAPALISPTVTTQQASAAVVVIHGDRAQGTGFILKTADGLFVATHLHLLAANPRVSVTMANGTTIKTGLIQGAADRDLALLAVTDAHLDHLTLPADFGRTVKSGDGVIVPRVGEEGEVSVGDPVPVGAINPGRIDLNSPLSSASVGAPLILEKSGDVVAIATATPQVDLSSGVAQAWPLNADPDSARLIPYFGLRIDDVRGWETYDAARFMNETLLLAQFHRETRQLDSYLNGTRQHHHHGYDSTDETGPPDGNFYRTNEQINAAHERNRETAKGADHEQQLDAARQLLFELQSIVDAKVDRLQSLNSPYTYDRDRVREELAYRRALKEQLDGYQDDIESLDDIARSH
jgi:hypothetical protein